MFRSFVMRRLARVVILFVLASLTLTACSILNRNAAPTPTVDLPTASPALSTTPTRTVSSGTATRTPSPRPTASATPTLTVTPLIVPTPPANGITLTLAPDSAQTGWVSNASQDTFKTNNQIQVGLVKGQTYSSLVQFDLSSLAPGSQILFAAFELVGSSGTNPGNTGQLNLDLLNTQTTNWTNANFETIQKIPALLALGNPIPFNTLTVGAKKTIVLAPQELKLLAGPVNLGSITIRLSTSNATSDGLFVWDTTPGAAAPLLDLVVIPAAFTVVTTTPTPVDIFAEATRVIQRTVQAKQYGTATPLPRAFATATPGGNVIVPNVPTSANPVEAAATSAYVTAVAVTTGTFTPVPTNWLTATPMPIIIPFASLTPQPTATLTATPINLADIAQRSLPGILYNKIAFLSGDRIAPTAWIVDPDGSHLAQLSDRSYYAIAAARDVISPDGTWLLYNAPNNAENAILQIWRKNLKSPSTPPEQLTFHTRGFSFAAVWSPDGSKYAYTSTKDGGGEQEIFMYDYNDPKRWTRLTFSQDSYLWNQYPTWSPDGKQIAFSSDRGHISSFTELWVMNADGSGAKNIGDGKRDAWAPVWIKWSK